jgi:RNA polymerase sigma factor (sigma-70 family)
MSWRRTNSLIHALCEMSAAWRDDVSSDGDLLARFAATRDEDAFRMLVARHGSLVWSVCLGVLREPHDAEEAFQSTFLALARRADGLTGHTGIASWLQTVAKRTARNITRTAHRQSLLRRRVGESLRAEPSPVRKTSTWQTVEAELEGLPPRLREAVTYYYLEGRTHAQTAEMLGCSTAEAHRRVEQGQSLIRQRLAGRGELASVGSVMAALAAARSVQGMPPGLLNATVHTAVKSANGAVAAAGAATAATVTAGGWRIGIVVALMVGAGGGVALLPGVLDGSAKPVAGEAKRNGAQSPRPTDGPQEPSPAVRVGGRVTDARGVPVAGAVVTAFAPAWQHLVGGGLRAAERLAGGTTDASGGFALEVPTDFLRVGSRRVAHLSVWSPGRAAQTVAVQVWPSAGDVAVRLPDAADVRGRVVDPEGRPAGGVRVCVVRQGGVTLPEEVAATGTLAGWPAAVRTDEAGEFCFRGACGEQALTLHCRDDRNRWAGQRVVFDPSDPPADADGMFVVTMPRPRVIAGRVAAAGTGEPVAGCRVRVDVTRAPGATPSDPSLSVTVTTDAAGRYECRVQPGHRVGVAAYPPEGVALPAMRRSVLMAPGDGRQEVDVVLPPGKVVEGTVADEADRRPLANVAVEYMPSHKAVPVVEPAADDTTWPVVFAVSADAEGRFRAVVADAPGGLYVREAYAGGAGRRAGRRWYAPASKQLAGLDSESPQVMSVELLLRRMADLRGEVVRADGTPAGEAALMCRGAMAPGWAAIPCVYPVRGGRFAANNVESSAWHRLLVVDSGRGEGAVATLTPGGSGASTVRLQACGSARVRLLDAQSRPAAGYRPSLFVFHPDDVAGDDYLEASLEHAVRFLGVSVEEFDPAHYGGGLVADADGWLTLPALIPGAVYSLRTPSEVSRDARQAQSRPLMPILVTRPGEALRLRAIVLPAGPPDPAGAR